MSEIIEPKPQYQCRHIFPEGRRCGSCSLRGERFCYFHHTTRTPIAPETRQKRSRKAAFTLPTPEDRASIQHALGLIVERIARNELDTRRAGLLLYALQIATQNLPTQPQSKEPMVEEILHDPQFGILAPETILPASPERDLEAWLLEGYQPGKHLKEEPVQTSDQIPGPTPGQIPHLQAAAASAGTPLTPVNRIFCATIHGVGEHRNQNKSADPELAQIRARQTIPCRLYRHQSQTGSLLLPVREDRTVEQLVIL